MYKVDYQTGSGNFEAASLGEAMDLADQGASFTQESILIRNKNHDVVAFRNWVGCTDSERLLQKDPIEFGCYGYYADWTIL